METCKLTRHGCNYAPFNPTSEECHACVEINSSYPKAFLDTCTIKPEKYEELREQDFDVWLDMILNEIIEQVNRQSNQLDAFNAKFELLEDRVDALKDFFDDLEAQINDLSHRFDEFKKFIFYPCIPAQTSTATEQDLLKLLQLLQQQRTPAQTSGEAEHTCSNFCGNCAYYQAPTSSVTLPTCELSGEDVDPDDSSCAMFEPPF